MGEVVHAKSAIADIEADVRTSLRNGMARGGEIAAMTEARLGAVVVAMTEAKRVEEAAKEAEAAAWPSVASADADADGAIGRVRDAMFNALGRPRTHPDLVAVFPEGITTYTKGDPLAQPRLMKVLEARIAVTENVPAWTAERRAAWVAELEAARLPLFDAATAYGPLDAARTVAEAGLRAVVRSAQSQLVKLKRDFKNHGLTEAQIHEIIPDASRRTAAKAASKKAKEPAS